MNIPRIIIPREIWSKIIEGAKKRKKKIVAFGLFSERGKRYFIKDFKEIEVEIIKEDSSSGPIFRFRKQKEKGFYPPRNFDLRYAGTVIIQKDLDLTFHYAYWMGREGIDFNINLRLNDDDTPEYKSFWVEPNKTDGEFLSIEIILK